MYARRTSWPYSVSGRRCTGNGYATSSSVGLVGFASGGGWRGGDAGCACADAARQVAKSAVAKTLRGMRAIIAHTADDDSLYGLLRLERRHPVHDEADVGSGIGPDTVHQEPLTVGGHIVIHRVRRICRPHPCLE